jgi:hypothetical protein
MVAGLTKIDIFSSLDFEMKKAVNPKTSLSKSDSGGDLGCFLVEAINCLLRFRFSAESFLTPPGDKIIR